jgi:zona occludens toxin (predicted ATPase)
MDNTHRLRFLIYFAAFMLVMSLCFAYAEPVPTPSASTSHLLLQACPQHAAFLASSSLEPAFDPAALRATLPPTVSPAIALWPLCC